MRRDVLFSVVCLVAATLLNLFKKETTKSSVIKLSTQLVLGIDLVTLAAITVYGNTLDPPVSLNHLKLKPHTFTTHLHHR